jgi:glycosyltransferase involved in cell wall biosynthesis
MIMGIFSRNKNRSIYIPFKKYSYIGGPVSFMRNLQGFLDENRYVYTASKNNASGIFFPIKTDVKTLKYIKKRKGFIIQRLDGVYYRDISEDHEQLNAPIKQIYNNYADHVIFQSEYSRKQCFSILGEKEKGSYSIILNGADEKVFYPESGIRENDGKINFITTGAFRHIYMLEPIIQALDMLKGKFDFHLKVIGPLIEKNEMMKIIDRDYVSYMGKLTSPEVADQLRQSDIFLSSLINPPCPNSVIEAISCALPVVGFDSGSMKELCSFSKELLVEMSPAILNSPEELDSNKLVEKIMLAVKGFQNFKKTALNNHSLQNFKKTGKEYMEILEKYARYTNP